MTAFRVLLAAIFVTIVVYTSVVVANHGLGLLPVFFGDIAKMEWPGQFNLDFSGFLVLSALWLLAPSLLAGWPCVGSCWALRGGPPSHRVPLRSELHRQRRLRGTAPGKHPGEEPGGSLVGFE